MKLLFENWREYLKESEEQGDPGIPHTTLNKLDPPQTENLSVNQLNQMDLKYLPESNEWTILDPDFQERIKKYAEMTQTQGVGGMPPIRFMDSRLEDGGHRINAIYYLDHQEPVKGWLDQKLPVALYTSNVDWKELEKEDPYAFMRKSQAAKHIEDTITR
jgi:hypothetical protein